jgi:hypothetical protein
MDMLNVLDIDPHAVLINQYDLAVFSCGYEARSKTYSESINRRNINKILTLYFSDSRDVGYRRQNEIHFNEISDDIVEMKYDDDLPVYEYLNKYVFDNGTRSLKIMVDYSSMSRLWYISILNWARYAELDEVLIDFVYSVGDYSGAITPLVIDEILAIPGHEGVTTHSKTLSIFGLGYDSLTTLCVLDKLEPSVVHSFIAGSFFENYIDKTESYNKEFIDNYSEPVLYFPFTSVEKTYRMMSELISPYRDEYNISFIPMGPKPHVLAAALVSLKYSEIINLYVKGKRHSPPIVKPNGDYVCTRVSFSK